jgi:hypothetical protein
MAKKSKEELAQIKAKKRKANRIKNAIIHYGWTSSVLVASFWIAVRFSWDGFKVLLILVFLAALFLPDGLKPSEPDEVILGAAAFYLRAIAFIMACFIASEDRIFFYHTAITTGGFTLLGIASQFILEWEKNKKRLALAYAQAQDALSENPDDPGLRRDALQAGREYYAACRGDGTITVYDEAAINNDILACLGKKVDSE